MIASALLTAAASLVVLPLPLAHAAPPHTFSPRVTKGLVPCLEDAKVPYKVQTDADWYVYATTFNARLQYEPAAIAVPTTQKQVSDAVVCASENGIKVQAKSGGHSYASFSTGGRDGILVVDLENFADVSLDNSTHVAKVGGGVRLGNMAQTIYDEGKRAVGHGTCPGVGVGGHFTHGGYGYSSRAFGLALEQIVALDVVLANGSYVHASSTENCDVYWAMRGAADAFGIALNFYIQTSAAPSQVVNWAYSYPQALESTDNAVRAFQAIQKWGLNASNIDRKTGFGVTVGGNGTTFSVHGTYFGSIETWNKTIAPPLLASLPWAPANDSSVEEVSWVESLVLLGGAPVLTVAQHGYPSSRDNFFAKSITTTKEFPEDALRSYFGYMIEKGTNAAGVAVDWFTIINLYGGPDSQIGKFNEEEAAYGGFDDLWVIQNYASQDFINSTYPASGVPFVDGLNNAMTDKLSEWGAYLNYVDPSYSAAQAADLYYGKSLYSRLQKAKAMLDPRNVFSNPQSITEPSK